jgi:hypothetical protein
MALLYQPCPALALLIGRRMLSNISELQNMTTFTADSSKMKKYH